MKPSKHCPMFEQLSGPWAERWRTAVHDLHQRHRLLDRGGRHLRRFLLYYEKFVESASKDGPFRFFLTSAAIGILYKENASISGAEVGCQGEVDPRRRRCTSP